MATIKSFTDISQSKKLAEILLLESADYFHAPDAGIVVTEPYKLNQGDETVITAYKGAIPCWSLAALIKILPYGYSSIITKSFNGKDYYCKIDGKPLETYADNPVDACYEFILNLNKLNLL